MSSTIQGKSESSEPKFRLACDECTLSKVKCTKERPSCTRCATQGLNCVYGLARKKHQGTAYDVLRRTRNEHLLQDPDPLRYLTATTGTTESGNAAHRGEETHGTVKEGYSKNELGVFLDTERAGTFSIGFHGGTFGSEQPAPGGHFAQFGLMGSENASCSANTPEYLSRFSEPDFGTTLSDNSINTSSAWQGSLVPFGSPSAHRLTEMGCEASKCLTQACATMRSLEWPTIADGSAEQRRFSSPGSLSESSFNTLPGLLHSQMPPFEELLRTNEVALQEVVNILYCPCANSTHMLTLCASILGRVLDWYRHMWRLLKSISMTNPLDLDVISRSPTGSGGKAHGSFSKNSAAIPVSYAESAGGSSNVHELDSENRGSFFQQAIMNGLKSTDQVIDLVTSVGRKRVDREQILTQPVSDVLTQWLKTELKLTVGEISGTH